MKKNVVDENNPFYALARDVSNKIKSNRANISPKILDSQKHQVMSLLKYENLFKKEINKYKQSSEVYKKFLLHIVVEKKNILSAKPFFREKSEAFNEKISPLFKNCDYESIKEFDINYNMVRFIRDSWKGKFPKRAEDYFNKINFYRGILIEQNMPLAINEAKKFYRKVPESSVSLSDMTNLCAQGLCMGIDKWSGPYREVFRSVCLSRMTALLMSAYSQTPVHFAPNDAKVLYKINQLRSKIGTEDMERLTEAVNESLKKDKKKITSQQIIDILGASSPFSSNVVGTIGEISYDLFDSISDRETTIEDDIIDSDILDNSYAIIKEIDVLTRKIIRLKGLFS